MAQRVVDVAAELKRRKYNELASILGEQYQHARSQLSSAETSLKDFRVRTANVFRGVGPIAARAPDPRGEPAAAQSIELQLSLEQMRRDRRAIQQALKPDSTGGLSLEALGSIPAVRESPRLTAAVQEALAKQSEIRALRYRYTEQSAPVQRARADLVALEQRSIPALATQLLSELSSRETIVTPRVDSASQDLRQLPPLMLEQARLERGVVSAEALFSTVGQRYEAARLAQLSTLPGIRILDTAVEPRRPAIDYAPLLIGLSLLASLVFIVAVVTLRDRVDPRLRSPEQITREMQLPILGAVPHVSRRARGVIGDGSDEVIEALRGLRVRVLHAHGGDGPVLLTVTSPASGEGKSFVSVNLALSFAFAGYQTLLIDGDVRRGAQHKVLETHQQPGLTDVLAGQVGLEAAIQKTSFPVFPL